VLNYNGKAHLDTCLGSVLRQTGPLDRVYLVDNGSTDGSVEFVRQRYPAIGVICFDRNLGYAEAYNRAVASANEALVIFLNNDVEVDDNWLAELKSGLEKSTDRVAACGSKILFYHDRSLVNHAGGTLAPIGAGIDLDLMKPDKQETYSQRCVGCVSGASMIMPRSVFLKLGGFDTDFFAYFEDVDLSWRAWLAGYRVVYRPSSRVYHKLSATMGPFLKPERIFLGERNRLQCMLKNLQVWNLIVAMLVSCLYTLYRLLIFLRSRRPMVVLAILRGDWWVLTHLPRIVAKRRRIQQRRQVPDAFLVAHGLMLSFTEGLMEFSRLAPLRSG
jgi:GT2 family glycosyltransferase